MAPASASNQRWVAPATGALWSAWILIGLTSSASAQVAPTVSPPVASASTEVPYPSGAKGDSVVLLEILVAKDGTVSETKVLNGEEPFAEQARQAVLRWQ